MACEVTYKGTKYSRNEFIELLYNGELDKLMPKLDQRYFVGTYAPEVKKYNPLQDVESTTSALNKLDDNGELNKIFIEKEISIDDISEENADGQKLSDAIINVKDGLKSQTKGKILVYESGGKYYIADGFHRVAEAKLKGDKFIQADVVYAKPKDISEAYHKAKADGTNPELVKAVEDLLGGGESNFGGLFFDQPIYDFVNGGQIKGKLFNEKQSEGAQKEIESSYSDKILDKNDLRPALYNYDNPWGQKNVNGRDVRIVQGFIRKNAGGQNYQSWLLYSDGKVVGEFENKEDAKKVVDYIAANLVKEIDSVNKAEQRLKDAWNNFKNSGIATDKFEEIKREVELVKALFDYAWKKGIQTAKDVYDYVVGAISGISDTHAKRLSNKVEGLLNNPSGLVDEVLDMYAPIVAEQGLELSDVKQFMDDTFYKGGKFDTKAANEWLKNETADIDEQEKRLWSDLISAATQQKNTIGTPRPQPQAPPQQASPQPQAAPQPQATTETQNIEWLNSLLGSSVTKENFPVILFDEKNAGGVEKKRISAGTQEEVFERKIEEDASYISVTIQTLGEIAQDDAKAALDKFGKNWIGTMLSAFESGKMNMSTMVRAIGLLSYISNDLNNKITSGTSSRAELDALLALQRRADALSIKFSSWASLGMNARKLLRKFAMGQIAMNDLSARVIGDDVAQMVEAVERIMQEQESNEDLNAATAPIPKARKKRSVVNRVVSAIKPKSGKKASAPKATAQDRQNIINDAIAEKRKQGMEGVSRQDLLNSIRERINKCK